jgi:DNA polymerase I
LFGAGDEKVSLTVTGKRDKKLGEKIKKEFAKKIPGFSELLTKIEETYKRTKIGGNAFIPGLDGTKVYIDSQHKALNYLLQKFESVTCKSSVAYCMKRLDEEGIPWEPLIFYHDEIEFEVPEQYSERAAEIAKEAFREAAKEFDVFILDGEAKIGNNWLEVH